MAGETIRETESRFNPSVPDVQEEGARVNRLLNISRSIQQPQSPKGTMYALEGIGKGIEEGAKGFDYSLDKGIETTARPRIEATRDEFENRLDAARQSQEQNVLQGGAKAPSRISLLSPTPIADTATDDWKSVDRKAQMTDLARANGKITETDYYARMDTLRKEFITRYPGKEDVVDRTFEKYAGFNSANKLIASKISDLNALVAAQKEKTNKDLDYLRTHSASNPNYVEDVAAIKAGISGELVVDRANARMKEEFDYKLLAAKYAAIKHNEEYQSSQFYQLAATSASQAALDRLQHITWQGGKTIPQMLEEHLNGNIPIEPGQGEALANVLEANKQKIISQERAKMARGITDSDPNSPTYGKVITSPLGIMGHTKSEEALKEGMVWFDDYISQIRNEKYGLAFQSARDLKAVVEGTADKMVNDPKYGALFVNLAAEYKLFGNREAAFDAALKTNQGVPQFDQDNVRAFQARLASGLPWVTEQDANGVYSFKRALRNGSEGGMSGEGLSAILRTADWVESPTIADAEKKVLLKEMYSKYNAGMVAALAADKPTYDANGNQVGTQKGRESAFHDFTSEGKLKEAYRLSGTDKQIWDDAKNWIGSEFSYLYQKHVIDINQAISGVGTMGIKQGYKIGYDDVGHKFVVTPSKDLPVGGFQSEEGHLGMRADLVAAQRQKLAFIESKLSLINDGLRAMATAAKVEGNEAGINDSIHKYLSGPGFRGASADVLLQAITHSAHPLTDKDRPRQDVP